MFIYVCVSAVKYITRAEQEVHVFIIIIISTIAHTRCVLSASNIISHSTSYFLFFLKAFKKERHDKFIQRYALRSPPLTDKSFHVFLNSRQLVLVCGRDLI